MAALGNSVIELSNIKKTYVMGKVEVPALKGINLALREGEMAAIMGPSGSGKTTLLNILGLLDVASIGSYRLNREEVGNLSDDGRSEMRNRHFGFVFQIYNLLPRLNALENIAVPLLYAGVKHPERMARAQVALEAVGLAHRAEHYPNELSGGEQQRVAIARALINQPSVILADEPTGNLDSASGEVIIELLRQINREKQVAMILVTHDPGVAAAAGRVIRLRDGLVEEDGVPDGCGGGENKTGGGAAATG
jgi:putative ABC transport system ATP-binding protein